jgi:hypothetical protein
MLIWSKDSIDHKLTKWFQTSQQTSGMAWYPTDITRDVAPIPCHSHNDYWRKVPLYNALHTGCIGVEADVWLFDEDLYVGHNTASLTRNRTFKSLYVNPLVEILTKMNPSTDFSNNTRNGLFDTDPDQTLVLLVDIKTSGRDTWPYVLQQLQPLRDRNWLTWTDGTTVKSGPITVVGTGNAPFDLLTSNTTYRDAFFDAPLEEMWEPPAPGESGSPSSDENLSPDRPWTDPPVQALMRRCQSHPSRQNAGQSKADTSARAESNTYSAVNSYYASTDFSQVIGSMWRGRLSPHQLDLIRGHVRGAHKRGLKARYWELPRWPIGLRNHVWDVLVKEGVDILNVDDLRAVRRGW